MGKKTNVLYSLAVLFLLISCETTTKNTPQIDVKMVFDVPSLIGKNIDEIRQVIGMPSDGEQIEPTKQQMKMSFEYWDNSFEKDGKTLLITFNPQNRKVKEFFISTNDPSGATEDYSDLLLICNVTKNSPEYRVEPVPSISNNKQFTGIIITQK